MKSGNDIYECDKIDLNDVLLVELFRHRFPIVMGKASEILPQHHCVNVQEIVDLQ
jgi:hypothetical protein